MYFGTRHPSPKNWRLTHGAGSDTKTLVDKETTELKLAFTKHASCTKKWGCCITSEAPKGQNTIMPEESSLD